MKKADRWDITLRFTKNQERVLRLLAMRDERSINAIVRRLVDQASRRAEVRKLLDGDAINAG